jgi:hypothetical protein
MLITNAAFSIAIVDSSLGWRSRANVGSIVTGKLSTQKYPRSSNAFVAELIPEPLRPVIIISLSVLSGSLFLEGIDLRLDQTKIAVLSLEYHRDPFGFGVPENKKVITVTVKEHRGLLGHYRFDAISAGTDDARAAWGGSKFGITLRYCTDLRCLVRSVDDFVLQSQGLLFYLINRLGKRFIHVGIQRHSGERFISPVDNDLRSMTAALYFDDHMRAYRFFSENMFDSFKVVFNVGA